MSEDELRVTGRPITLSGANRREYLPLLTHAVRDFARLAGFAEAPGERAATIAAALAGALMNPSLEPVEGGSIDLTCEPAPGGMKVVLHDDGPPFDPSRSGRAAEVVHGLLEEGSPDWVSFRDLGRGGKEVEIMLHLPGDVGGGDEPPDSPADGHAFRVRGDRPGAEWIDADPSLAWRPKMKNRARAERPAKSPSACCVPDRPPQ